MEVPDLLAFDRVCVLNPAGRVAQRRHALAQFDRMRMPIDCERVRLVSVGEGLGASPDARQWAQLATHCALAALRQARIDGLRHVLIVQDDVVFEPPGAAAASLGSPAWPPAGESPSGWALALLGHGEPPRNQAALCRRVHDSVRAPDCVAVALSAFDAVTADLEAALAPAGVAGHRAGAAVFADVQRVLGTAPQRHPLLQAWVSNRSITVRRSDDAPERQAVGRGATAPRWRKAGGSS